MKDRGVGTDAARGKNQERSCPNKLRLSWNTQDVTEQEEVSKDEWKQPSYFSQNTKPPNCRGNANDNRQAVGERKSKSVRGVVLPIQVHQTSQVLC